MIIQRQGKLDPKAELEVVGNHGGIFQIDGHFTFGQEVATRATEMAFEKTRDHGVSLVTMGIHTNKGRIGTYPAMADKGTRNKKVHVVPRRPVPRRPLFTICEMKMH